MTREQALSQLEEALYKPDELEADIAFFCKKLQISRPQFDELMAAPSRHYSDFPNWDRWYRILKAGQTIVERVTGKRQNVYS